MQYQRDRYIISFKENKVRILCIQNVPIFNIFDNKTVTGDDGGNYWRFSHFVRLLITSLVQVVVDRTTMRSHRAIVDLQLLMQSVPITTNIASSNPTQERCNQYNIMR